MTETTCVTEEKVLSIAIRKRREGGKTKRYIKRGDQIRIGKLILWGIKLVLCDYVITQINEINMRMTQKHMEMKSNF
jgi:hypothetical protein